MPCFQVSETPFFVTRHFSAGGTRESCRSILATSQGENGEQPPPQPQDEAQSWVPFMVISWGVNDDLMVT